MTAAATAARPRGFPPSTVHQFPAPPRQMSGVVLGEVKRALTRAMLDVQAAGLHSRGYSPARETIVPAYLALRTALDVVEAAYKRGVF